MAEVKSQELVALSLGFYKGNRIKVGQSFLFVGEKLPKWAAPKADVKVRETGRPVRGDTKPLAAAKAAKAKAVGAQDADPLA